MTPLAKAVLAELEASRRGFKAHALAKTISEKRGRPIAPNSIYRALRRLEKEGYVRKIVSSNIFVALENLSRKTFCMLTCHVCGEIGTVQCYETGVQLKALAETKGFKPETLVIEMIGSCAACQT
jgi:Fur family transcriptional regulator, zinc uptake regulator